RQHAEICDQFVRRREAVGVSQEGGEHGGGDGADARDGVEVVSVGEGAVGGNQQVFQAFLPGAAVAELADLFADQLLGGRSLERGNGGAGVVEERGHVPLGHIRDIGEFCWRRRGEPPGGGVAVDEFEHPAGGQVVGEQGQFREGQGEQVVELVAQP